MNSHIPKPVIAALVFLSLVFLLAIFAYGVAVQRYRLPPYGLLQQIETAFGQILATGDETQLWYYQETDRQRKIVAQPELREGKGLNLVSAVGADGSLILKVMGMDGVAIHRWPVDWFDVWPDATHLTAEELPKSRPGTHIHGIQLLPDGDIVFNYEKLGMVRMGLCGEIRWKLPYRSHHSLWIDDDGFIWAPGQSDNFDWREEYPAHAAPVREPEILKISPEGEIVRKISVFDVLRDNGQEALLYLRAESISGQVRGDTLHLNDVEVFPRSLPEGFFSHGDIMLSLRNINTIVVLDGESLALKLVKTGEFVRQHDPDFIDGNTISLYDNNNVAPAGFGSQSRIMILDAPSGELRTWYEGTEAQPFFSNIMGKHQWLAANRMLVTDSVSGRAFEVDANGRIDWEYVNLVDDGLVGLVEEVTRLPAAYATLFADESCGDALTINR